MLVVGASEGLRAGEEAILVADPDEEPGCIIPVFADELKSGAYQLIVLHERAETVQHRNPSMSYRQICDAVDQRADGSIRPGATYGKQNVLGGATFCVGWLWRALAKNDHPGTVL